ncbi:hypothetical protein [[Phormidium] sp. ETS-05]|uniref:hypothetical protein n=1 Tax=[Phormidium] sp. ETS-05 TaxID=222819 RepID=UPI0018EED5B5|nr:hypothetical protein [[Phormidium] sp. ETS-05]
MDTVGVGNATFVEFGVSASLGDCDSGDVVVGVGEGDRIGVIVVVFGVTAGGSTVDIVVDVTISNGIINTGDGDGLILVPVGGVEGDSGDNCAFAGVATGEVEGNG